MDFIKTQETLIKLLPLWQNKIARPFKQILDEGITCEMYNCMQFLVWFEDGINCARCTAARYSTMAGAPFRQNQSILNSSEAAPPLSGQTKSEARVAPLFFAPFSPPAATAADIPFIPPRYARTRAPRPCRG